MGVTKETRIIDQHTVGQIEPWLADLANLSDVEECVGKFCSNMNV